MSYRFQKHDGGRSVSRRPKQQNDCTVRALAVATGMPYDDAYDILKEAGRQSSRKFKMPEWMSKQPLAALRFEKMTFPSVKGQPRMNPVRFCSQFPYGTFIVRTAKHVFVIRDGVAIDTEQEPAERCIYSAWRVVESSN